MTIRRIWMNKRAILKLKPNHPSKIKQQARKRKNRTKRKGVKLKLLNKLRLFLSHKINRPLNIKSHKYIQFLKSTPKIKIRIKGRAETNQSKWTWVLLSIWPSTSFKTSPSSAVSTKNAPDLFKTDSEWTSTWLKRRVSATNYW